MTLWTMKLPVLRWLLDPVTCWQALWLSVASRGRVSFDVAWRRIRVERFPDEAAYQQMGHLPAVRAPHEERDVR